jgi:hypothetical protein
MLKKYFNCLQRNINLERRVEEEGGRQWNCGTLELSRKLDNSSSWV